MEPVFVALMVLVLLAGAGLCVWVLTRLAGSVDSAGSTRADAARDR